MSIDFKKENCVLSSGLSQWFHPRQLVDSICLPTGHFHRLTTRSARLCHLCSHWQSPGQQLCHPPASVTLCQTRAWISLALMAATLCLTPAWVYKGGKRVGHFLCLNNCALLAQGQLSLWCLYCLCLDKLYGHGSNGATRRFSC